MTKKEQAQIILEELDKNKPTERGIRKATRKSEGI